MFCTVCGHKLPEEAAFCTRCGSPVHPAPEHPSAVTPEMSATEFFGAPAAGVSDAPPVAPEPEFDPDQSATEFFAAPPVSGDPTPAADAKADGQAPSAPEDAGSCSDLPEGEPPRPDPEPEFDPDQSATEFFAAPPVSGDPTPAADQEDGAAFFSAVLEQPAQPSHGEQGATEFFSAPPAQTPPPAEAAMPVPSRRSTPQPQPGPGEPEGPRPPRAFSIGRRRPRKGLIIALIAAGVLLIAGIVLLVRFLLAGDIQPVFYLRDGRLLYLSRPDADPIAVMDDVAGAAVTVTEDGKYAYLTVSDGSDTTLYRAELGRLSTNMARNQEYILQIDTDIAGSAQYMGYGAVQDLKLVASDSACVSPDGETVYYLQGDGSDLRRFHAGASETLAEGVSSFQMDPEGGRLLIWADGPDGEQELQCYGENGIEAVASDVAQVLYYTEDFSEICYTVLDEDDTYSLYAWDPAGGSERLVSDAAWIYSVSGRTDFTYMVRQEGGVPLMDYVEDDMAAQDAALVEPRIEDFQTTETYTDFFGNTRERTTTDYDAYWDARDTYRDKERRDNLRQRLEEETYDPGLYALYVRQAGTDSLVCDQILDWSYNWDDTGDLFVYQRTTGQDMGTIPLSEIDSIWDMYDLLDSNNSESVWVLADASGELTTLDGPAYDYQKTDNGDFYLLQEEGAVLTRYTQAGGYADPQVIAEDVYSFLCVGDGSKVYYSVSESGSYVELYCWDGTNSTQIAGNLALSYLYVYDDGALAAMDAQGDGQLRYCAPSGEWVNYGEGSNGWCRLDGDRLMVLSDGGILYTFDGKERAVIANDVTGFCCPGAQSPDGFLRGPGA